MENMPKHSGRGRPDGWEPSQGLEGDSGLPFESEPLARAYVGGAPSRMAAMLLRRRNLRRQGQRVSIFPWRPIVVGTAILFAVFVCGLVIVWFVGWLGS